MYYSCIYVYILVQILIFYFPLQVKNKPHDEFANCAFIFENLAWSQTISFIKNNRSKNEIFRAVKNIKNNIKEEEAKMEHI
jgi:hypothetical protein